MRLRSELQPNTATHRKARRMKAWQTIGWIMVAIVVALSVVDLSAPEISLSVSDKLAHVIAYVGLAGWFVWARPGQWKRIAIWLLVLGVVIELIHGALPYRSLELLDVVADGLGIALGSLAALILTRLGLGWHRVIGRGLSPA